MNDTQTLVVIADSEQARSRDERLSRLRQLEAEGVVLAEQLRLSPTARIESMLHLNTLCSDLCQ